MMRRGGDQHNLIARIQLPHPMYNPHSVQLPTLFGLFNNSLNAAARHRRVMLKIESLYAIADIIFANQANKAGYSADIRPP